MENRPAGIPDFSTNALNSSSACPKITLTKRIKGFLALLINSAASFTFQCLKLVLDYNF
jgi:hypothetical protein